MPRGRWAEHRSVTVLGVDGPVGLEMWTALLRIAALADVLDGPAPCSRAPLEEICHDSKCHPDNSLCPPVTTEPSCGEWPHSGRDGAVLTWGLSYRASSAQACCDKCKAHPRRCNSWTFCPLTVCWGLDTGHNHTFGGAHAEAAFKRAPCGNASGRINSHWLNSRADRVLAPAPEGRPRGLTVASARQVHRRMAQQAPPSPRWLQTQ